MARNVDEIYASITSAKDADSRLAALDSSDELSVWRRIAKTFAGVTREVELLFDKLTVEIQKIIDRNIPGTPAWYAERSYEFQFGHPVIVVDGRPTYAVDDADARIVKYASVQRGSTGNAILKIAKQVSALPAPLTPTELNAFQAYVNNIMFAGSYISVRSIPADKIKLTIKVWYDALYTPEAARTFVEATINSYINDVQFDGYYRRITLTELLIHTESVKDIEIMDFKGKKHNATLWTDIIREYQALSGYARIDDAYPLSTNLLLEPSI